MRKGMPFIISAPSGAGKSTLAAMLLAEFPNLRFSVSCTTRPKRPGETEGRDYYFLDKKEFERHIRANDFAEWAVVHGNFYGTLAEPAKRMLASGRDVLFDVDVQGAARLKLTFLASCFVFILPPSLQALEIRLKARGQDSEEVIQKRLEHARGEIGHAMWYDALVFNENLESAYQELRALYIAATLNPWANAAMLAGILEGANG